MEFDAGDNESGEYKVEAIWDSAVYAREWKSGYLPGLYYLVSGKGYPEEENTWEPASAVQYLRKLISLFSTRTILTSRLRLFLLLTTHHRWLDRQSSRLGLPNKSKDDQLIALTNELNRTELRLIFIIFLDEFGYLTHWTSFSALYMTTRDCMWLHMIAHDFQPTFIKTSTFRFSSLIPESTSLTL